MALLSTIQKFIAGTLLLLFAFSLVPRKLLHDRIASHHAVVVDTAQRDLLDNANSEGLGCNCDLLFAQPDINTPVSYIQWYAPFFSDPSDPAIVQRIYAIHDSFFSLRGPPSLV